MPTEGGLFTNWGTKAEYQGGITVEKGKRARRVVTKRAPQGETTKAYSYDKREKSKEIKSETPNITYGARYKPEKSGGMPYGSRQIPKELKSETPSITYGERYKPKTVKAYEYGKRHYEEPAGGIGGYMSEKDRAKLKRSGISFKSIAEQKTEQEREAKRAEKAEKKRIKQIEKEANRIARRREEEEKKRKKEQAARAKRWKKSYRLSRKSPLASKVRKIIRF